MEESQKPIPPSKTTVSLSRDTVDKLKPLLKYGGSIGDKLSEIVDDYLKRKQSIDDAALKIRETSDGDTSPFV
jgi:hypothetical protein